MSCLLFIKPSPYDVPEDVCPLPARCHTPPVLLPHDMIAFSLQLSPAAQDSCFCHHHWNLTLTLLTYPTPSPWSSCLSFLFSLSYILLTGLKSNSWSLIPHFPFHRPLILLSSQFFYQFLGITSASSFYSHPRTSPTASPTTTLTSSPSSSLRMFQ